MPFITSVRGITVGELEDTVIPGTTTNIANDVVLLSGAAPAEGAWVQLIAATATVTIGLHIVCRNHALDHEHQGKAARRCNSNDGRDSGTNGDGQTS